jgi:hypothetical protein
MILYYIRILLLLYDAPIDIMQLFVDRLIFALVIINVLTLIVVVITTDLM